MSSRDTYNYRLKAGRKTVYVGVTNDPTGRAAEHAADGKNFDRLTVEGRAKTREGALARERESLESYRRNHGGENPKYNKTRNG